MKIVADSNIPFARDAFGGMGEVEVVKGPELSAERLRDCDVLICRSTRRIDAGLLDGTRVRFVATATIGVDHVDMGYLERRGIGFASAPGSNANSVSEYITSALLVVAERMGRRVGEMRIGVVGVGNVGSRVVKKAEALGMTVLQNDPPLERRTGGACFRPIDELMDADVITLHVPLEKGGAYPTYHMVDEVFLGRMKRGAVLINSARGGVVDGRALHGAIDSGRLGAVVLDVWEGEPVIDTGLLGKVWIGTPHIAGHSFDGKVNGTKMVYDAACKFLGLRAVWTPLGLMPEPEVPVIDLSCGGRDEEDVVREAVLALYDVRRDDADLRGMPGEVGLRGGYFEGLRRNYWMRREFQNTAVRVSGGSAALAAKFAGLGFSQYS